jgi:hypothetical protein
MSLFHLGFLMVGVVVVGLAGSANRPPFRDTLNENKQKREIVYSLNRM